MDSIAKKLKSWVSSCCKAPLEFYDWFLCTKCEEHCDAEPAPEVKTG